MALGSHIDATFEAGDMLEAGEYENCTFSNIDFSNGNLSHYKFIDCTFVNCNLSMTKIADTSFQDLTFKGCKMLGLRFDTCHDFALSFRFDQCILDHASFFKTKIKKTTFSNSRLHDTEFQDCDLSASLFDNCDLSRANFVNTNLEKCDFRTSFNYSLDPERNRIKKARFSIQGVIGLLDKYDIVID